MQSTAKRKQTELELRGPERSFQLDRDTVIVYTGMHEDDVRPFIRIGAGASAPEGLLKHIENVVLPDADPVNVGLEMFWLHSTLEKGGDMIRYVGSRDQVSRMYSYSGMKEQADDKQKSPVEILAYQPPRGNKGDQHDKTLINFYETGNVNVMVDGARALDLDSYRRGVMHLDKEYQLIDKALKKRNRRCEEGHSFLYLDRSKTPGMSLYWNLKGQGLMVNPPRDFHYALFENAVHPDRVSMAISGSPFLPGFVEVLRRRNAMESGVGFFTHDPDKIPDLKKIYSRSRFRVFEDSAVLPYASDTSFFLSRSGSHALFAMRMSPDTERHVQVLFPLGFGKPNRSFQYLKAPHDLVFETIDSKTDLKELPRAYMTLHTQGKIATKAYDKLRLDQGVYPLVGEREYKMFFAEKPAEFFDKFSEAMAETAEYGEPLKELLLLTMGLDFDSEKVTKLLEDLGKLKRPRDPVVLNNVHEALRFIQLLPRFNDGYDENQARRVANLLKKNRLAHLKNGQWRALRERDLEFHVLFMNSKDSFLLAHTRKEEVVRLEVPPPAAEMEKNPKGYRKYLNQKARIVNRAYEAPGYNESLDFLDQLYEERLRLVFERNRFKSLLQNLGLGLEPVKPPKKSLGSRISEFFKNLWEKIKEKTGTLFNR